MLPHYELRAKDYEMIWLQRHGRPCPYSIQVVVSPEAKVPDFWSADLLPMRALLMERPS